MLHIYFYGRCSGELHDMARLCVTKRMNDAQRFSLSPILYELKHTLHLFTNYNYPKAQLEFQRSFLGLGFAPR